MITCTEISSSKTIRRAANYLVLSLETTGPQPGEDRILRLGMARVTDGEIVNRASTLVDPGIPIPHRVTELTGISDPIAATGRSYPEMAESLSGLLLDGIVVADPDQLAFVRCMLEENGMSGEIRYIDLAHFAQGLVPGLPDYSPLTLAAYFDVHSDDRPEVVADCVLRHLVLDKCVELADEAAGKRGGARHAAKKKKKKRAAPEKKEDLSTEEVVCYVASAVALIAAIINYSSISGLLFLLAGVLLCPIPALRRLFGRIRLSGWKLAALAAVLAIAGVLLRPGVIFQKQTADGQSIPAFIILSWDKAGDYGTPVEPEGSDSYMRFYLPRGIYRVLNNSAAAATVNVYTDKDDKDGVPGPIPAESLSSVTVLGSKSKEITVDEGQYVVLSDKSENVIFQYLSEIPEVDPNEQQVVGQLGGQEVKIAYVTGDDVRMRRTPSVGGFIMTTFNKGQEVQITAVTGDWSAVTVGDMQGYIYSSYLSDINPLTGLAAPTPTPAPAAEEGAEGEEGEAAPEEGESAEAAAAGEAGEAAPEDGAA